MVAFSCLKTSFSAILKKVINIVAFRFNLFIFRRSACFSAFFFFRPYFLYSSVYLACGKVGRNQTEKPKKKRKTAQKK